jgi:hypothetical protein
VSLAEFLRQHSGARETLVVSSDRFVQRSAKKYGAEFVRSEAFYKGVLDVLDRRASSPQEPGEKREGLDQKTGDEWLRTFGFDPDQPSPFEHP